MDAVKLPPIKQDLITGVQVPIESPAGQYASFDQQIKTKDYSIHPLSYETRLKDMLAIRKRGMLPSDKVISTKFPVNALVRIA